MCKIVNLKPRSKFLGFLIFRIKLNKEAKIPISKEFLRRYKKLNKEAYELTKLNKKNED